MIELVLNFLDLNKNKESIGEFTDGSHSYNELYYDRMVLFSVICETYKDFAWKSLKHSDGIMYKDYFVVGIDTPKGQFSYHYHVDYWNYFSVKVLDLPQNGMDIRQKTLIDCLN